MEMKPRRLHEVQVESAILGLLGNRDGPSRRHRWSRSECRLAGERGSARRMQTKAVVLRQEARVEHPRVHLHGRSDWSPLKERLHSLGSTSRLSWYVGSNSIYRVNSTSENENGVSP